LALKNNNHIGPNPSEKIKFLFSRYWIIVFLAFLVVLVTITVPYFWSKYNLIGFLSLVLPFLCISIGLTSVMLAGEIDLSVGSTMAFASILVMVMQYGNFWLWLPESGAELVLPTEWNPVMHPLLIIICICLLGALIGSIIGSLHVFTGMQGFVASLIMYYLVRGLAICITGGQPYSGRAGVGPLLKSLTGRMGEVPTVLIIIIVIFLLFYFLFTFHPIGRSIYAVGGNLTTANLMGINIKKVKIFAYALSGFLAAFAGIWATGYFGVGDGRFFEGYELYAIGMVVLGGTTFRGGRGGIINTLGGVLVFSLIMTWVDLLGIDYYTQTMLLGFLIVFILVLNKFTVHQNNTN
jgi:ribose/xylose/arabinose/galactoside ABC-type transport system permease subunit